MFDESSEGPPPGPSGGGSSPEVIARFDAWAEEVYGRREALSAVTEESAGWMERIGVAGRVANQGAAAQLVAIGELFGYRLARGGETDYWAADTMAAVTVGRPAFSGLRFSRILCREV